MALNEDFFTRELMTDEEVFNTLLDLAKDNIVERRIEPGIDTFYEYLICRLDTMHELGRISFWEDTVALASLLDESELTVYKYGVKVKDGEPNMVLFYRDDVLLRHEVLRPMPEEGSDGYIALMELKAYLDEF